jgi:hypothetical protein
LCTFGTECRSNEVQFEYCHRHYTDLENTTRHENGVAHP